MLNDQLTWWWVFRRIQHPEMKAVIWTYPLVMSLILVVSWLVSPHKPDLLGGAGVFSAIVEFFLVLPGFYIAAIAGVASIESENLDEDLGEGAPYIEVKDLNDEPENAPLNRRNFILYGLNYVFVLSLTLLFLSVIFSILFEPDAVNQVMEHVPYMIQFVVEFLVVSFLAYFTACVVITTVHMVYFLSGGGRAPL